MRTGKEGRGPHWSAVDLRAATMMAGLVLGDDSTW
jgi:hypothetical protein